MRRAGLSWERERCKSSTQPFGRELQEGHRRHAWLANASGFFGTPARFKYAGLAQMTERTWPTRRARSAESGSDPILTPRSMPSSASETTRSSSVSRK